MYDVSSRATFEELSRWYHELETYASGEVVKIVVGNKARDVHCTQQLDLLC